MRRAFISNVGVMMALNLLIKPFWVLGIDRTVQNILGPETYGMYYNLVAFTLILSVILEFGINNYTSSQIAKYPEKAPQFFAATFSLKILYSLTYLVITILSALLFNYNGSRLYLLMVIAFTQVMSFFNMYFRSNVSGLHFFKTDSVLSIIDRVLMIVFCSAMIWGNVFPLTLESYIYAQTLSYTVAALCSFLIVKSKIRKISFVFDKEILIQIFKSTYPYALLAFIMMAYTRVDSILLRQLLPDGDYQNGIYSQGYRLLDAGNMMIALIAVILLPLFSRMLQQKENVSKLVDLCVGLMIVPSLIICSVCIVFRVEVMNLLYHHSTDLSVNVFAITMISFISFSFMYVFGTLLTANGSLHLLNKLAFIALVLNVLLNIILIPVYKSLGAAYAALITQGFIAFSNTYFAYTLDELQFNRPLFVRICLYTISILIFSMLLKYYIFSWFLAVVVSLSLATILLFTFKIFNLKLSLELLKNKLNA